MNAYVQQVLDSLAVVYPHETEFLQAAREMLPSLGPVFDAHPEYQQQGLLERFVEPERIIIFRVPWVDDKGQGRVNRAFRVQFSSAIGPYKGGMRFHPSVNASILKFLALEQTLKNSLTGLPLGGGKGGSDFDPKGKTDGEIMRFCQSLINELYRHIGQGVDVPAGDIGVGAREVGYMYGQYKRLSGSYDGSFTGKGISYGGSLGRMEATGFGLLYLTQVMLEANGLSISGMKVIVSGSGNVAIHAAQKAAEMGATVIAMSDSQGFIEDQQGIDLQVIQQIKLEQRERISHYPKLAGRGRYQEDCSGIWHLPCELALPCATQNELDNEAAQALIDNGVRAVAEGANMPCTLEAVAAFRHEGVLFAPGKAANAGGVAVSGLEMSQNAQGLHWSFEEVDSKLKDIMEHIFQQISKAAKEYGSPGDYAAGANIAGFVKVAQAMAAQGSV